MKPRLKSSPAARELIKRFEPLRETAIRGADGRWVVGYGHRAAARGGIKVSEEEASLLLIYDVMRAEGVIDDIADIPLSRGQRDALVSFVHDIGADAFRNSDVARFLYEGRMDAAGEALAAHGDGTSARREAESRMFLNAMVPAQAERPSVELVIKVEHPREERVLEGAVAGGASEPVEDYAPPPPPPMPDRAITSRAEAEAEIARILATVEAMPLDEREPAAAERGMAPVESAVADLSDEPVEAAYEAVETPEPETEAPETVEPAAEAAPDMPVEDAERELEAAAPQAGAPIADFSLPAGTELGFVLAGLPEALADDDAPQAGAAEPGTPVADLPVTVGLGYAFTSVMQASLRTQPEAEPQPEPQPEPATAAPEHEPAADVEAAPETAAAPEPEAAVTEIVERAVAVAGQDAPPPHPSDTPAESRGAVGEVEAEPVEAAEVDLRADTDPLLDGEDPLTADADDEDDAFSPRDLAADLPPETVEKTSVKSDDGSWGYLASLAAGAVVTAFGAVMTWGDWGRMWDERSLTGDAWALIAGVFLMLAAAWSLGSVWLERLKKNRRNTADAG